MLEIINSTKADLPHIADCHKKTFPTSLSSAMGKSFLIKMLEWYVVNDFVFLFHLEEDGKVIGYCGSIKVDGKQNKGSASGMAQYSFKEAVFSFLKRPWLVFHPELRKKYRLIKRNILYKIGLQKPGKPLMVTNINAEDFYVGLVVIGIDPACQGKGYSSIILKNLEQKAKVLGAKKLRLTVLPENLIAIQAYKKNGWIKDTVSSNSISMYKLI
jgi:GNAT superfamily N-acetyltransferase